LNLKTAVDSDDTADYLTLSLADSLRTVDALYNNVTGHTHSGIHQGGPIGSVPVGALADGSITSAKIADGAIATVDLADGAITTPKLAANAVTQDVYATFSGSISTTASDVDTGDLITITTSAGSDLLVAARFPMVMSGTVNALLETKLLIDGVGPVLWFQVVSSSDVGQPVITGGWAYVQNIAPGSHTIKTRWSTNAGTLTQWVEPRALLALEFKK
jgi:hypothetical protein